MLLDYYKLREQPFGVTPDPRFWLESETHREALASLLYGLESGRGFVALIARPGMGKTTLLFRGLQYLQNSAKIVFLFQTISTPEELLQALLADLGVQVTDGNLIQLQSKLNDVCAEYSRSGKQIVVVIDEAQNLDVAVLEFVRMLSNFESPRRKLLQIVLAGQPQLGATLWSPSMLQLRQRISIFACLKAFSLPETTTYIEHRLRLSGYIANRPLFTGPALAMIAEHSEGIPRNINNICFNAMSLACALKRDSIDEAIIREVVSDLSLKQLSDGSFEWVPAPRNEKARESNLRSFSDWQRFLQRIYSWNSAARIVAIGFILLLFAALPIPKLGERIRIVAAQGSSHTNFVYVKPGQSLFKICVENFGVCSPAITSEIKRLNPGLQNLNHLNIGQKLRIPDKKAVSQHADALIAKVGNGSPTRETRDE